MNAEGFWGWLVRSTLLPIKGHIFFFNFLLPEAYIRRMSLVFAQHAFHPFWDLFIPLLSCCIMFSLGFCCLFLVLSFGFIVVSITERSFPWNKGETVAGTLKDIGENQLQFLVDILFISCFLAHVSYGVVRPTYIYNITDTSTMNTLRYFYFQTCRAVKWKD